MDESIIVNVSTNSTIWTYHWSFVPVTEAVIFPCVVILNSFVLALFIGNKRLSIPFNIYLTSVLVSNLVFAIMDDPLDILNFVSPYWWLGDSVCTLYLYAQSIPSGILLYSHALITINRIWAVTFPHSYRQRHSVRIALFLVIFVWVYVHMIYLPIVLMDAVLYRLPIETSGCIFNIDHMTIWYTTTQFIVYSLPNAFMIVAYPYLLLMRRRKRKMREMIGLEIPKEAKAYSREAPPKITVETAQTAETAETQTKYTKRPQRDTKAFAMFTASTLSIFICWTPLNTFYTVWCFVDLSPFTTALQFCQGLFVVQPALDPIFFALIMPGIRSDVVQFFRKFPFGK